MGTWHVVAWHTSNGPALVWSDGESVDWVAATLPGIDDQWLTQLRDALASGNTQSITITTDDGEQHHVAIYPADSPTRPAYGAAVWVGRGHESLPPVARRIAGLCWDHHEGQAIISQTLFDMSSNGNGSHHTNGFPRARDPQTLTRKLVAAPDIEAEILQACMTPVAGTISGAFTVLHDRGHLMNWRIDAVVDPDSRMTLLGVVHDVSDVDDSNPPLHEDYGRTPGAAILTHTQPTHTPVLASLITDRHPWMHQTCPSQDLIHPDDIELLASASELIRINADAEPVVQVRARSHEDSWVTADVLLARYPTHTLAADRMRLMYFHPAHPAHRQEHS